MVEAKIWSQTLRFPLWGPYIMGFVCFQQMLYKKVQCSQLLPFNPPFRQGLNIFGFVMDTLPSETWFLELEFTPFQPFASSNHWFSGGELAISFEGNRLVYPELPRIPKPAVGWKALKRATSDIFKYLFWSHALGFENKRLSHTTCQWWKMILYDAFHLGGESTRNILCNCCSGTKTCLETTTSDSPSIQKAFKQSL